jgi:predicted nicotinamide N-methyase
MTPDIFSKYDTVWRTETIGDWDVEILQLVDFEAAVDKLINHLQLAGRDDILPEDCPYFGQIWSASRSLATEVSRLDLKGKTSLEVGCGLALPSLVAARNGAACTALDIHPDVYAFIEKTLEKNALPRSIDFKQQSWTEFTASAKFDLILGSDILYENQHPSNISDLLLRNLSPDGMAIIIDPCRWHHQEFAKALQDCGFHVDGQYSTVSEDIRVVRMYTMHIRFADLGAAKLV